MDMYSQGTSNTPDLEEIATAVTELGVVIRDDHYTDPKIIREMLKYVNLDLDHFPLKSSHAFEILKQLSTDRISLKPLKETILLGIRNNPPLYQTILRAKGPILFNQAQVDVLIQFIVIIEVLTFLMLNDQAFQHTIIQLLRDKGTIHSANSTMVFLKKFIETHGNLFETIKYISVNPYLFETMICREYPPHPSEENLNQFIQDNQLTQFEIKALKKKLGVLHRGEKNYDGLCANILEALVSEYMKVHHLTLMNSLFTKMDSNQSIDNIKSGFALVLHLEKYKNTTSAPGFISHPFRLNPQCRADYQDPSASFWNELYQFSSEQNHVKKIEVMTQEWVNLYISWNATFILTTMPEKNQMILPKLFIPSTLCSMPEFYISARTVSLWLTIQFLSAFQSKRIAIEYRVPEIHDLISIVSKCNAEYAQTELLKSGFDLDGSFQDRFQTRTPLKMYWEALRLLRS